MLQKFPVLLETTPQPEYTDVYQFHKLILAKHPVRNKMIHHTGPLIVIRLDVKVPIFLLLLNCFFRH